jgi:hypothetical protein
MIYLDAPQKWNGRRKNYSHMVSDVGIEDLRNFADMLGIRRHWFHKDHYDVREFEYDKAIAKGATVVSTREIVRIKNSIKR